MSKLLIYSILLLRVVYARSYIPSASHAVIEYPNEIVCLGRYTGSFHSYIYYSRNASTTDEYYVLRTAWLISYPAKIRSALVNTGVYVLSDNPVDKCGWTVLGFGKNTLVDTGTVLVYGNKSRDMVSLGLRVLDTNYPLIEIILCCTPVYLFIVFVCWVCVSEYKSNPDTIVSSSPVEYSTVSTPTSNASTVVTSKWIDSEV